MNILYLHGLDSKLSPKKRGVLEKFGTVYAPDLNYYDDAHAIETILAYYPGVDMDVVIGSSMGGFAGYYVADAIKRPALLFNPALKERSVDQNTPSVKDSYTNLKQIVLGQIDEVISPVDTLDFLSKNFNTVTHIYLHLVPDLGHNIPVPFLEKEVSSFLQKVKAWPVTG